MHNNYYCDGANYTIIKFLKKDINFYFSIAKLVITLKEILVIHSSLSDNTKIQLKLTNGIWDFQLYRSNVIRVRFAPSIEVMNVESSPVREHLTILPPEKTPVLWNILNESAAFKISIQNFHIIIDKQQEIMQITNHSQELCLSDLIRVCIPSNITASLSSQDASIDVDNQQLFKIQQKFLFPIHVGLYGMGQFQNGHLNHRNTTLELFQKNTQIVVPLLLCSNGIGILWENYSRTDFSDNTTETWFKSDLGHYLEYFLILGRDIADISYISRALTGGAPLLSKWAYGFWQSRNRYWSQQEILSVVEKQRNEHLPLDVIVLDYMYWGKNGVGSHQFSASDFPNPKKMIETLHKKFNCHFAISVWPCFAKNTENFKKMNDLGYLLPGSPIEAGINGICYDSMNKNAGKMYWELLEESLFQLGVDIWWFDATEPDNIKAFLKTTTSLGPAALVQNLYALYDMGHVFHGQKSKNQKKRVCILTRSGFTGQQKYATILWSGDINSNFRTLRKQIPAGLNLSMAGIPYWTTDIGGYKLGEPRNPIFRELMVRWFQYGIFCPICRVHGRRGSGNRKIPTELWATGGRAYKIMKQFLFFRYRMLPYIYSLAGQISHSSYTLMRALVMDFPDDSETWNIVDEFMFGSAFLVAPVTRFLCRKRKVYLPQHRLEKNRLWYDFWTGKSLSGGQTIIASASLDRIPLYIPAGTILPLGPEVEFATQESSEPLELRVYPGADGNFVLYEDDGETYDYEANKYSKIRVEWKDQIRTLVIHAREGKYVPSNPVLLFKFVIVNSMQGIGLGMTPNSNPILSYVGKDLEFNANEM